MINSIQKIIVACVFVASGAAYSLSRSDNEAPTTETFRVELCTDGDTCRLFSPEGKKLRVRLVGIDAPETRKKKKELGQPFALEAKDYLNKQIQGQTVSVKEFGNDMYGRMLGEVYFSSRNINLDLVRQGLAEVYRGKAPPGVDTNAYVGAQSVAQREKLGIWSQSTYQSPKEYRKHNKH